MRYILLFFLFLSTIGDGLQKASRINETVQQANQYYQQQHYEQAIRLYRHLYDELQVKDNALLLNLAHATYHTGDLVTARKYYNRLRDNPDLNIKGAALNQLGIIAFEDDNAEKALYYFRIAIIQNPQNEIARYNYEMVKKYQSRSPGKSLPKKAAPNKPQPEKQKPLEPEPKAGTRESDTGRPELTDDLNNPANELTQSKAQGAGNNAQQPTKQPNEIPPLPENGGDVSRPKGTESGNEQGISDNNTSNAETFGNTAGEEQITEKERKMQTLRNRLQRTGISAEKATMLLEAMRNAELQYLQQVPRQPTKRPNKNKPDW